MSFAKRRDEDPISSGFDLEEDKPQRVGFTLAPGLIVLAVFLLVLACAGMMGLVTVSSLRPAPPQPTAIPPVQQDYSVPTAREAFVPALELIRQTDPGAELASAVATWYPTIDRTQLAAGRSSWAFHFYLPASEQMATVTVGQGVSPVLRSLESWPSQPALLDASRWLADSPLAISNGLVPCQEALASRPDAYVEARFSTTQDHVVLLWNVSVRAPGEDAALCEARLDAVSGIVR